MRDLQRRVLRLEGRDMPGLEPKLIVLRGGLSPDAMPLHASIGRHHRLTSAANETEEEFQDRCLRLAEAMGEAWITIGTMAAEPLDGDFPAG